MRWWGHPVLFLVLSLPLTLVTAAVLARLRPSRSWRRSLAETGMVFGTLPWVVMILTPVRVPPETKMTHLVPLSDIAHLVAGEQAVVQIGGNLCVLAALGLCAPVRWAWAAGAWRLLGLGAAVSLGLEVLQRLLATGRVFSVDDILLNALGCLLGGLLSGRWWATDPRR